MEVQKLEILYQDHDLIAINKPAGMLVHRTNLDPHENIVVLQILRDQIQKTLYPFHRLDRPTSGVLIFALSSETANKMTHIFSEKQAQKKYLAVVRGYSPNRCVIDYALKEELDSLSDKKARQNKPAQSAVTEIETLGQVELPMVVDRYPTARYSLVQAMPQTGRKHQIRRHLRHLGHPIIGDINHGVGKHNRFFAENLDCKRLLLACTEISFQHPRSNENLVIKASLCPDYKSVLKKLGWDAYAATT